MKKIFVTIAIALSLNGCGQKEDDLAKMSATVHREEMRTIIHKEICRTVKEDEETAQRYETALPTEPKEDKPILQRVIKDLRKNAQTNGKDEHC